MSKLILMAGPPRDKSKDGDAIREFMTSADFRVVCGGTTSRILCRYLGKELVLEPKYFADGLMAYGCIGDIIATEGVVTLTATARYLAGEIEYLEEGTGSKKLAELLTDAHEIKMILGSAVNPEHRGELDFKIKEKSLHQIKQELEKLGKKVDIIKF